MKKHFFALFAVSLFVASCSSKGGGEENSEEASARLFLGKLNVPMFDSISVVVSAADMESIRIAERAANDNLRIDGIPQGENRKFEVKIYADSGKLVQEGEANADIRAGESISIQIHLNALAGFLRLEVPLGVPNNTGVHSGKLFLDSLEYSMEIENGKGVFNTNSLPLDRVLNLSVKLYDVNGELLFIGSKSLALRSISQTETLQLESTKGSAILELQAIMNGPAQIFAMLPESLYGYRAPENYGDLFFTEIFADPLGGDSFQYMEIYNITLDTLELSSCRIARDASISQSSGKISLPIGLIIEPMKYLVLGRSNAEVADYKYASFALLKTGQSLGFFCGDLAIDTLTYSNKGDNIFPLEKGSVMQLPLENYETRVLGTSWCMGFSPKADAACQ